MRKSKKDLIPEEMLSEETNQTADDSTAPEEKPGKQKGSFKKFFHSTRFKRGGMATVLTVFFIVAVILVNVVFSILETRFPSLKIDMTQNKIYSLSEDALDAAKAVTVPTTIYILASEDVAKSDSLLSSYGLKYSQVSVLAEKMEEANSLISVKYIDLEKDPSFSSNEKYKNYTLSQGSVLLETDYRVRVLGIGDLYTQEADYTTYSYKYYMQVDSALTSALMQVTAEAVPVVSIATGSHNEILGSYLGTLQTLLEDNGFEFKTFDILTEDIPEATQLLILPAPSLDYSQDEISKLDAYLADTSVSNRSIWALFYATQGALPNLSNFLYEWGLQVSPELILETDRNNYMSNAMYFFSTPNSDFDLGGSESYKNVITPAALNVSLVSANTGASTYLLTSSSSTCYVKSTDELSEETASSGTDTPSDLTTYGTTGLSVKMYSAGSTTYRRSIVAFGSASMLVDTYLSSSVFGNATYVVDLARYSTGTTDSSIGVVTDSVETNTLDISITQGLRDFFGIGVFMILIPLSLIVAGIVVFLKRRHL